jgi:hypothetical protein
VICTMCQIDKPVIEFYTRRTAHGLKPRASCKACQNAAATRWRRAHPERNTKASREYYYRNLETRRAVQRAYHRKKKEAERELQRG